MLNGMSGNIGSELRTWRERRRLSQLHLALDADISQRHLSFMESGRSVPSREMLLRLAERLDVPLRERNKLLVTAGYAPVFAERALDDPAMQQARATIDRVLAAFEPFPALVIDRHWHMVAANRMVLPLSSTAAPRLLAPPVNVLRLTLDPEGLAPSIENLDEWRAHLLARLARQHAVSNDPALRALEIELRALGGPVPAEDVHSPDAIAVTLRMRSPMGVLSFISSTMVFGAPLEVNLSELAIEIFLPVDAFTTQVLETVAAQVREA